MTNIGLGEVLFILILAFIILGPNDLIKAARTLGLLCKKIKSQYNNIQQELNDTLNIDNISSEDKKNNN